MSKSALIAAGFSAHLGVEIKTKADAEGISKQKPGQVILRPVTIHCLFSHTFNEITPDKNYAVQVFGEDRQRHQVDPNLPVKEIKMLLAGKVGIHPDSQTLLCGGIPLQDSQSLVQQNIRPGIMIMAWGRPPETRADEPEPVHYINEADLDSKYDYDFTNLKDDGTKYQRGGYVYNRPYGWDRAALKVLKRYSDDVWLGEIGDRTGSSPGEWVVSYHGTASENARPIIRKSSRCRPGGYKPGWRKRFGEGIYSSPSIKVAENPDYSKPFVYEGQKFQMVLQNRVNLAKSEEISAKRTGVGAPYFRTEDKDNIRPYGVLLRKL